ncbi:hypothetical protein [Streptomyces sp. CRN 30]|uniref:hypothetical protein n=1 Tax=Streptomyces sp. CRN 30 TaxID=3075613 RepID=UPI002A81CDD0|nr:hypothetical protein [Streptomyces sp. CRN 30]
MSTLLRTPRRVPAVSATTDAVLTAVSAFLWLAFAELLYLESQSYEPHEADYPPARPFFLLAFTAGASLLVTWALRKFPLNPPHRFLAVVAQVRTAALGLVWLLLCAAAVLT